MCGFIEIQPLIPRRTFLPPRPPALQPIRPSCPLLNHARGGSSAAPDLRHPFLRAVNAPQQAGNIQIDIKVWPMQPGPTAQNFHPRNLIFCAGLQPLQVFARDRAPAAVVQLQDEQIQSWSRPVFDCSHKRPTAYDFGALNCPIDFGVRSNDPMCGDQMFGDRMSGDLMPCHVFPPTIRRAPQNAGPRLSKFSSHLTSLHSRAERHRSVPLGLHSRPREDE